MRWFGHKPITPLSHLRSTPEVAPEDAPMARLFAQVGRLEPIPETTLARMRRRLVEGVAKTTDARSDGRLPLWLRAVAIACVSLVVLEVAAAATLAASPSLRKRILHAIAGGAGPTGSSVIPLPDVRPPLPIPVAVPVPAPAEVQPQTTVLPAEPASARPHKRVVASAPADASGDAQLFSQALSQLNVQHDPQGALAILNTYRERHPAGLFLAEATALEIRADLMLGKEKEALSSLDQLDQRSFSGIAQATELRLLRAELLGRANRCGDALPVFAGYRAPSVPIELRERALYADAICRARLKDLEASRNELNEYLHEFPQGRFAPAARRALNGLP
jgi:hypothetical protein